MPPAEALFRVLTATKAGDGPNQDRVYVLPSAVVLLDGTGGEGARDGGWYAEQLGHELVRSLRSSAPLTKALGRAIGVVASQHQITRDDPSAAIAIVRWTGETVDSLVLGDCRVTTVLRVPSEPGVPQGSLPTQIEELCDQRLDRIGADLRRSYRARLRAGAGFDADHRALLARMRQLEGAARNLEGGYFIAQGDEAAVEQATIRTWRTDEVIGVCLTTDGAWAGPKKRRIRPDLASLAIGEQPDLDAWLSAIADTENADSEGRRWPRSKRADDKTVAVVTRTGAR